VIPDSLLKKINNKNCTKNYGKNKNIIKTAPVKIGASFVDNFWEKSWTYIETVVDVVHEPVLILDKNFCIMAANESFYKVFQVNPEDTEGKIVYELGNGQWNIPDLRKLLEDILPNNIFFKGFEVAHEFPSIGYKVMILNARQIYVKEDADFPPIILLAMEDVTEMMSVAEMLSHRTKQFEAKTGDRIEKLESYIKKLEKEIDEIKTQPKTNKSE